MCLEQFRTGGPAEKAVFSRFIDESFEEYYFGSTLKRERLTTYLPAKIGEYHATIKDIIFEKGKANFTYSS